jgi:hypothetical protein
MWEGHAGKNVGILLKQMYSRAGAAGAAVIVVGVAAEALLIACAGAELELEGKSVRKG